MSTRGVTGKTRFRIDHEERWRNEVAEQLNVLLARADYFQETSNDDSDKEAEAATLAIVERVADFEEIEVEK